MIFEHSKYFIWLLSTCIFAQAAISPAISSEITSKGSSKQLGWMKQELERNLITLNKLNPPVYFLAYRVSVCRSLEVTACNGCAVQKTASEDGNLQIEVRIGSHELDNFHPLNPSSKSQLATEEDSSSPEEPKEPFVGMNYVPLDRDNDGIVLRQNLWIETEKAYRRALDQYEKVLARKDLATESDKCPDFSREPILVQSQVTDSTSQHIDAKELDSQVVDAHASDQQAVEAQALSKEAQDLSQLYREIPDLDDNFVYMKATNDCRYIVNSEGTAVSDATHSILCSTSAMATAQDGDYIKRVEARVFRSLPEAIAAESQLSELVKEVGTSVSALRKAAVAEPFCGPTLLKGEAAAVMFHEVLGHRLEASRHRERLDAKTFDKMIDHQILPDFISVYDRPLVAAVNGIHLVGHYLIDDEGVRAQDVTLVDHGKLVGFLMSRRPVPMFAHSNGHGRSDGNQNSYPCSRMGNLMVESSNAVSEAELRQKLIDEAKKQRKPYGLLIEKVESGLTYTTSHQPQYFMVNPSMVKRVYVDGRPDELIRDVRIVGTPLAALQRVIATSDQIAVFNGECGAESGWIPQANCSPSILVDYVETERTLPHQGIEKILPPPDAIPKPKR